MTICLCKHTIERHVSGTSECRARGCACAFFEQDHGFLKTPKEDKKDMVNHPPHYTEGGIECIDAIRAMLTGEEYRGFLKGQIVKYTWRERHKGASLEDVKKVGWYQAKLAEAVK